MSYDIWIEPSAAKDGGSWAHNSRNYTYNAAPMFEFTTGGSLHDLDGIPTSEALDVLEQAVVGMHVERDRVMSLQPENGWGNFEDFQEYVIGLAEWCEESPGMKVVVG